MAEAGSASAQVIFAAQAAVVDRTTARVVEALRSEGIRCLLLKGPVIERWLYDDVAREYVDVDLLVSPADQARVENVLHGLGYERALEDSDVPPFDRELHAHTWCAASGPAIDLHRTLAGVPAPPEAVWDELSRDADVLRVDGADVEVPGVAARAVLVALHAAHHGSGERKPLEDLARAVARLDRDGWASAAELAGRLRATEPFASGLRLAPAGRELADELGLPQTSSVEVALRADAPVPLALHVEWLHQAQGVRTKAALLLRLLFPPRAYMEPPPGTPRPQVALVRAYLARVAKLRHAPAALRAWRRMRR